MLTRYSHNGVTWIDLESPSDEERSHVAQEFGIPHLFGEDTNNTFSRFTLPHPDQPADAPAIELITDGQFFVTVRHHQNSAVDTFSKKFEQRVLAAERGATVPEIEHFFMQLPTLLYTSLAERYQTDVHALTSELSKTNRLLQQTQKSREQLLIAFIGLCTIALGALLFFIIRFFS